MAPMNRAHMIDGLLTDSPTPTAIHKHSMDSRCDTPPAQRHVPAQTDACRYSQTRVHSPKFRGSAVGPRRVGENPPVQRVGRIVVRPADPAPKYALTCGFATGSGPLTSIPLGSGRLTAGDSRQIGLIGLLVSNKLRTAAARNSWSGLGRVSGSSPVPASRTATISGESQVASEVA